MCCWLMLVLRFAPQRHVSTRRMQPCAARFSGHATGPLNPLIVLLTVLCLCFMFMGCWFRVTTERDPRPTGATLGGQIAMVAMGAAVIVSPCRSANERRHRSRNTTSLLGATEGLRTDPPRSANAPDARLTSLGICTR